MGFICGLQDRRLLKASNKSLLDLKDAIPIHRSITSIQGFNGRASCGSSNVLPFGLSSAPSPLQKLMATDLLASLGFLLNLKKSVLTPAQQLIFLGFNLDSSKMIISLPCQKLSTLKKQVRDLLSQEYT